MDEARQKDAEALAKYHEEIVKDRRTITQYEKGLAFFRQRIEERQYATGRLDERLGSWT